MRRRPLTALALASVAVSACGGGPPPPQRPERQAATLPALDPAFVAAAEGRALSAATQPTSLRWAPPPDGCTLRYVVDATMTSRMQGAPEEMSEVGMYIAGTVTGRARAGGLALDPTEISMGQLMRGMREPGRTTSLAEIRLQRDGPRLREVDGVTSLWSAFGSFPGLVVFFPELPPAQEPSEWRFTLHLRGGGVATEIERGSLEVPPSAVIPEPRPSPQRATVERLGDFLLDGSPASALRARWTVEESGASSAPATFGAAFSATTEAASRFEGSYVVAGGRLVFGRVTMTGDSTIAATGLDEPMRHSQEGTYELRLVEGCGGPTVEAPGRERPPEERAAEAYLALVSAALDGNAAAIEARLHPALRSAQPGAAQLLLRHVARFGPYALCATFRAAGVRPREGGGWEGQCSGGLEGVHNALSMHVVFEEGTAGTLVRALRAERIGEGEPRALLSVSPEGIGGVAAQWSPSRRDPRVVVSPQGSVRVPVGEVALVRRGARLCALRFDASAGGEATVRVWTGRPERSGGAAFGPPSTTTLNETDPIACGQLTVRWSRPDYLYVSGEVEVALTGAAEADAVDVDDDELTWWSAAWGDVAYDHARAVEARRRAQR